MDKRKRIEFLINNFDEGLLNENEFRELLDWYNSFDDSETIIGGREFIEVTDIKTRMYENILRQTDIPTTAPRKERVTKRYLYQWSSIAASVLLLSLGLWWWAQQRDTAIEAVRRTSRTELIQPGKNKATLKLADGTLVELRDLAGGLITDEKIQYADGTAVFDLDINSPRIENTLLELETPKGGAYRVTLDDGTQVWLNAGSKLKYPAHFLPTQDRVVEVQGEAYFKVKKQLDKSGKNIPFRVKANRQLIEVLGTEFNVSDYPHLTYSHTTLIEGKVAIENKGKSVVLSPSQQWLQRNQGSLVKQVDTQSITAWKDNKFNFANKSLEEVLDEIALWYDIQVVYQGAVPEVELIGDAYRDSDFNLILRLLKVAKVTYTLDAANRKLIIK